MRTADWLLVVVLAGATSLATVLVVVLALGGHRPSPAYSTVVCRLSPPDMAAPGFTQAKCATVEGRP